MALIIVMINALFLTLNTEMVKSTKDAIKGLSNNNSESSSTTESVISTTTLIEQTLVTAEADSATAFSTYTDTYSFSSEALPLSSISTVSVSSSFTSPTTSFKTSAQTDELVSTPSITISLSESSTTTESVISTATVIEQTSVAAEADSATAFSTYTDTYSFSSEALPLSSISTVSVSSSFTSPTTSFKTSAQTDELVSTPSITISLSESSITTESVISTATVIEQTSVTAEADSSTTISTYTDTYSFSSEALPLSSLSTVSVSSSFISPTTSFKASAQTDELVSTPSTMISLSESSSSIDSNSSLVYFWQTSETGTHTLFSIFSDIYVFSSDGSILTSLDIKSTIISQIDSFSQTLYTPNLSKTSSIMMGHSVYSSLFSIQASPGITFHTFSSKTLLLSSSYNSFSVFNTRILASIEIKFDFRMAFKIEFIDSLKNSFSSEYKKLENVVVEQLTKIFRNMEGFIKVVVISFEKGSVLTNCRIIFDKNEVKVSDSFVQAEVINNFMNHLKSSNDTVGGYPVDINSVKVERTVDVRISYNVATWIIIMIVALILLLALSVVILLQRRKIRDFKDRLYVSEHISAGSFSHYDKSNFELVQVRKISTKDMKKENEILKNNNEHVAISKSLFYGDINGVNVENNKPSDKDDSVSEKYVNGAYLSDD